jgi:glutathione S-transferase
MDERDQFDPAYVKLNPNAVVPTLIHDGNVIIESTVIMHYLDDTFADPALMPADPLARAKVHMITKLMDEYVHHSCTVLTFANYIDNSRTTRRSPRQLVSKDIRLADLGRGRQKFIGVRHQCGSHLSGEMRLATCLILERVEDREGALVEAYGEPGDGTLLGCN